MSSWIDTEGRNSLSAGFIYKIEHIPSGKFYIGKKSLIKYRTVNGKKVYSESDWENYISSNEWIKRTAKKEGKDKFRKEIIKYCDSAKLLTYYEVYYQMIYNVLTDSNAINENILGKFYKNDFNK